MSSALVCMARLDQAFRQSPIPALRNLQVEELESEVILLGSVSSYYLKQMAQEAILPTLGSRRLKNLVTVQSR